MTEIEEMHARERELRTHEAFEVGFPWSMNRDLQLRWWARYGKAALRYVVLRDPELEVVHDRAPDRFAYLGEETSRSESIQRRHTFFHSYPVRVVAERVRDLLGLYWNLPDGRKVGVKLEVNERTYTHEEDVAGA